jgi:hypothetical protein
MKIWERIEAWLPGTQFVIFIHERLYLCIAYDGKAFAFRHDVRKEMENNEHFKLVFTSEQ